MRVSNDNLKLLNVNLVEFLRRYVTVDETWSYCYVSELQQKFLYFGILESERNTSHRLSCKELNYQRGILRCLSKLTISESCHYQRKTNTGSKESAIPTWQHQLVPQPLYTPNLAPSGFHLFAKPNLKTDEEVIFEIDVDDHDADEPNWCNSTPAPVVQVY